MTEAPSILQIPLYGLYYIDSIPSEPMTKAQLERMHQVYSADKMQQIVEGLRWAVAHEDFRFATMLPGLKFSDQDAHKYLVNLLRQIEQFANCHDRP